ncbi:glucose-methanol-choline oxidoreductase, FAD/NAD(P)-binding domain protein [Artemisia annua]|uniref:Glucose-methanol-choline oxidoreductase, FAD/NAD(P)-binding domain protein n=1 Tax=Artemisia annua TaxID=35608 RepID=A0A2U1NTM1_ARTAN|nr:glucose-methanol-choline oxidoreductase, FAD/NAD(P)-binding domain protein [Artemisia annua]
MANYKSWRLIEAALVTILFLVDFGFAESPGNYTFLYNATQAPSVSFYDYIIIGGGTTGIPLATTLSANYSVLLLERGGSPYDNPNVTEVNNFGSYFFDTSPTSPSQEFIVEGVVNSRPRVLGGGTSINAGFYSRGEAKFNVEAKLTDEDLILDSYEWAENVMVSEPIVRAWQSALHDALLEAGVTPDNGFTYDHLVGTKVGGTLFDQLGKRHTAADLLQYANPEALSVFLYASVHKILFKTQGTTPTAFGVAFEDSLGKMHRAFLKAGDGNEIILAAGALGSPQLLVLSGIGPKEQLDALNISCVLEQPFVGKDVADNPLNAFFIPSPIAVERSIVQVVGITPFGSYIEEAGGANFIFADPSVYLPFTTEMGGFIFEKINGPLSKGELTIVTRNPADNPAITFNYFSEPEDLQKCVKGIETILNAVDSEAFSKYKLANMTRQDILDFNIKLPHNQNVHSNTSTSLEQHCKETVRTMWHYHGGCHIGQVVDDDYKVIGVNSLRVIDGSTILNSPGTNPQASVLMLGRYMGVTILNQRLALDKPYADW